MFSVLFEVHPKPGQLDAYLGYAKTLKPELERIDGFVDNIRYKSLQREGWILSLSNWRDEKSVVRWRTLMRHHEAQEAGRGEIMQDYHLRVGEIMEDTQLPAGMELKKQRSDETEVGEGKMATIITAKRPEAHPANAIACSQYLGLDIYSGEMLVGWDVYEAVLTPGDLALMLVWQNCKALEYFENTEEIIVPDTHRIRHVRIIRDYGMFDRREAPQYYPQVKKTI
jgi:heme-degrading monooxygenase HmoA